MELIPRFALRGGGGGPPEVQPGETRGGVGAWQVPGNGVPLCSPMDPLRTRGRRARTSIKERRPAKDILLTTAPRGKIIIIIVITECDGVTDDVT